MKATEMIIGTGVNQFDKHLVVVTDNKSLRDAHLAKIPEDGMISVVFYKTGSNAKYVVNAGWNVYYRDMQMLEIVPQTKTIPAWVRNIVITAQTKQDGRSEPQFNIYVDADVKVKLEVNEYV